MRWLFTSIVVVAVLVVARPAYAGHGIVVINTGSDVIHIRDLPADVAQQTGLTAIGYRHDLFGVFWLDLWRWGGEFVAYNDKGYAPLSADELQSLGGAAMPWGYRAPPGLMLILAGIIAGLVSTRRRWAPLVLVLGLGWGVLAALLYLHGVTIAFLIPAALGLHHVVAAVAALRGREPAEATPAPPGGPATAPDGGAGAAPPPA